MSKNATTPDEVLVVRFFETGSIEKVEAVFNIVCDKMRDRLVDRQGGPNLSTPTPPPPYKQRRGGRAKHSSVGLDLQGEHNDLVDKA